jgi:transcriptional regulator with XRE-family HTH domain
MKRQLMSRIASLRKLAGITQLELSRQAGVTENTVQNWEKGRMGLDQIERVLGFCQALNCQPEDLIEIELVAKDLPSSPPKNSESSLEDTCQVIGTHKPASSDNIPKSNIAELRKKAGLTQLELSRRAGVTENTVQNWERGRLGLVQVERVVGFCKALNCKVEDLIEYVLVEDTTEMIEAKLNDQKNTMKKSVK